jgi:hypothetical protein
MMPFLNTRPPILFLARLRRIEIDVRNARMLGQTSRPAWMLPPTPLAASTAIADETANQFAGQRNKISHVGPNLNW